MYLEGLYQGDVFDCLGIMHAHAASRLTVPIRSLLEHTDNDTTCSGEALWGFCSEMIRARTVFSDRSSPLSRPDFRSDQE